MTDATVELNTCTGAELGTQVWLGRNDRDWKPEKFRPVSVGVDYPRVKPEGGLWTAQWDPMYGGGWAQWCLSEEFDIDRNNPTWKYVYVLEPQPDANVLLIDTYEDLVRVYERWPHAEPNPILHRHRPGYPHWSDIAEAGYDGVHLTDDGQWATRLSMPLSLYGWDCESTLWLRWAFTSIEFLGARTFKALDPWWEE